MDKLFVISGICAHFAIIYGVHQYITDKKNRNYALPIQFSPIVLPDEDISIQKEKEERTEEQQKEEKLEEQREEKEDGQRCPIEQKVEDRLRRLSDNDDNTWSSFLPKFNRQ